MSILLSRFSYKLLFFGRGRAGLKHASFESFLQPVPCFFANDLSNLEYHIGKNSLCFSPNVIVRFEGGIIDVSKVDCELAVYHGLGSSCLDQISITVFRQTA